MHTVLTTPTFERQVSNGGLSDREVSRMISRIAASPTTGDLMIGTGGARKVRFARQGKGKSGGYRTIHYYAGEDVPVFVLGLIEKGTKANLSKAERHELAMILPKIADAYRAGVSQRIIELRRR